VRPNFEVIANQTTKLSRPVNQKWLINSQSSYFNRGMCTRISYTKRVLKPLLWVK